MLHNGFELEYSSVVSGGVIFFFVFLLRTKEQRYFSAVLTERIAIGNEGQDIIQAWIIMCSLGN